MIEVALCERARDFDSDEWIFEPKLDGERTIFIIDKDNEKFTIQNREGFIKTESYPEFSKIFQAVKSSCVLDGELIGNEGKSIDFHNELFSRRTHIGSRIRAEQLSRVFPLNFVAFDILEIDGEDITQKSLLERKKILREVVNDTDRVKVIPYVVGKGKEFYQKMLEDGFEGMVAKKINSVYEHKRSTNWLKVKPIDFETAKVIGYKETSGWGSFGAFRTELCDCAIEKDSIKQEYFKRAKMGEVRIEIRFQEKLPSGKLRFPKFNKFVG